jgi:hypothetical protein
MTIDPSMLLRRAGAWNAHHKPDAWYGPDGIDALIWADPRPYDNPSAAASTVSRSTNAPA